MPKVSRQHVASLRGEAQMPLWPETNGAVNSHAASWVSDLVDRWESPRVEVRLVSRWTTLAGWEVGWFARVDGAMDEWHPAAPDAYRLVSNFPW